MVPDTPHYIRSRESRSSTVFKNLDLDSRSSTVFKNLDLDSRSRIDDSLDLDLLSIGVVDITHKIYLLGALFLGVAAIINMPTKSVLK